jgi:hypothetical protein
MHNYSCASISLAFLFYDFAHSFRSIRNIVQFNLSEANPMVRLVPNVSYTLLFVMFLMLGL